MQRFLVTATTALAIAPALAAAVPEPSALERGVDADDYTFSHYSTHSANPYSSANNPWGSAAPPVTGDDLERLADLLDFDQTQRELARGMADELEDEKRLIDVRFAEATADAQAHHASPRGWEKVQSLQAEARERQQAATATLADSFYTDLKLLLTPEQEENWRLVELDRFRDDNLRAGSILFAESLDPCALIETIELPEAAEDNARPILHTYLRELEPILRQRVRISERLAEQAKTVQEQQQTMWNDPEIRNNPERAQQAQIEHQEKARELGSLAADLIDAAARVADHNRRTLTRLRETLSPDHAPKLDAAIAKLEENSRYGFADSASSQPFNTMGRFGDRSRVDMILTTLLPDDPESTDQRGMMPEEMKAQLDARQLEIVEQMEGLYVELMETGFGFGMGMGGDGADTLSEDQRNKLRDIRERYDRENERLTDRLRRATRDIAIPGDDSGLPPSISITTPKGDVRFQRAYDDPEAQQAAMMAMHGGGDEDSEIAEINRERIELNQRFVDEIREVLTISQRQAVANY